MAFRRHRFGPRQQAQGQISAGPGSGRFYGPRRGKNRRHALDRAFRGNGSPAARPGRGARAPAQAVAEAIDQGRQIDALQPTAAATGKRQLQIGQRLDMRRRQGHGLDAEAGIDALQLLGEEPGQSGIVAARPAGADGELRQPAVHAIAASSRRRAPAPFRQLAAGGGEAGGARRRPCPRDGGSSSASTGAPHRPAPAGGARSARRCAPAPFRSSRSPGSMPKRRASEARGKG